MKLIYMYKAPGDSQDMNRVDLEMIQENDDKGNTIYKIKDDALSESGIDAENLKKLKEKLINKKFTYENTTFDPKKPNEYPANPSGKFTEISTISNGGRRISKKNPTARRRRSSKARKARKARATRRK